MRQFRLDQAIEYLVTVDTGGCRVGGKPYRLLVIPENGYGREGLRRGFRLDLCAVDNERALQLDCPVILALAGKQVDDLAGVLVERIAVVSREDGKGYHFLETVGIRHGQFETALVIRIGGRNKRVVRTIPVGGKETGYFYKLVRGACENVSFLADDLSAYLGWQRPEPVQIQGSEGHQTLPESREIVFRHIPVRAPGIIHQIRWVWVVRIQFQLIERRSARSRADDSHGADDQVGEGVRRGRCEVRLGIAQAVQQGQRSGDVQTGHVLDTTHSCLDK